MQGSQIHNLVFQISKEIGGFPGKGINLTKEGVGVQGI